MRSERILTHRFGIFSSMKQVFFLLAALLLISPHLANAKKADDGLVPEYQMEGAGMTSDNAQQVLVSILSKNKNVSDADLGKCAVHGILFRDYDDATNSGFGSVASHKSIMGSPAKEKEFIDFFEPFFRNGDCNAYVQLVNNSRRVVKSGKQWKVSAIVRVNSSKLKKDLKSQGIVKNLGSGW